MLLCPPKTQTSPTSTSETAFAALPFSAISILRGVFDAGSGGSCTLHSPDLPARAVADLPANDTEISESGDAHPQIFSGLAALQNRAVGKHAPAVLLRRRKRGRRKKRGAKKHCLAKFHTKNRYAKTLRIARKIRSKIFPFHPRSIDIFNIL